MKDSENNYIKTNKIPGYNELVESMEDVAQEATLVNGIEEILSTTAKQGEDTGATLTDVQTSVEGIDETLTVALDEFLGDVSGYTSNKEIYDELTDENYGLEAIKYAVDNIELDTSDLAKQGSDSAVTLTSVDEKIDGFYNTFDADIASQLQEIIGDSTTGLTGTTQTEEQVSTLRTLQESISTLTDNNTEIVGTLQSMADSWAADVTNRQTLQGYTFANGTEANTISDILAKRTSLKEIYDTNITLITADNTFAGIATMKKINLPNLQLISSSASNCFVNNRYMEELIIPNCTHISGIRTFCTNDTNLRILDMTNCKESLNDSQQLDGCVNLIDLIIGRGEMNSFSLTAWIPKNALNASSQTLLTPEDIAAGFTSNLQKLLYNIREHIAANLPVAPNTITFSAAVKAAIQADQATADAFANKNWVIA